MTWGSVVRFLFQYFDTSKKKLTLARISPRNVYLNLFDGAYFNWRSLKATNIAKKTSLNYVWTIIFPWSSCSLKLQILRLFRGKISKKISLWNARSSHWMCSVRKEFFKKFSKFTGKHLWQNLFFRKETLVQAFSCEFCKISKNAFFTEHLLTTASDAYVR